MRRMLLMAAAVIALAATLAGCSSDPSAGNFVWLGMKDNVFTREVTRVAVGDTVTFTNNDAFAHTVTSKKDQAFEFASGEFTEEAFELTFDETGTFAYFCEIHPTMRATVNVT